MKKVIIALKVNNIVVSVENNNDLKNTDKTYIEIRGERGRKLLTLSLRKKGFRYFIRSRPGGGGRKHTPCSEEEAICLVESALLKKGGVK
jgi:hypothetical protein